MNRKNFLIGLGLVAIFAAGLACSASSGVADQNDLVATARSAATAAVGLAAELDQQALAETAQAVATQLDESGLAATAQAAVTAVDPTSIVATAQAFGTQAAQQGSGSLATVQAMATQFSESSGEPPEDIPIPEGELIGFVAMGNLVSYGIQMPFDEVLAYYQNEMPANGWTEAPRGNVIADSAAVLVYDKVDRMVTITLGVIPLAGETRVQILTLPQS
jgi:hypothetical protein